MAATRPFLMAALVALAAPACTTSTDRTIVGPVQDSINTGHARGVALAATASVELSGEDYTVVIGKTGSILAAINDGEVDQANFALQVVLATDIADFAGSLVDDHALSNKDLDDVVSGFGVGFIPSTTESDVVNDFVLGLDDLRSNAPADIDIAYIDLQVREHAASQVLLAQLRDMVRDDEMGVFIDDMQNTEDEHLLRAADLLATFF